MWRAALFSGAWHRFPTLALLKARHGLPGRSGARWLGEKAAPDTKIDQLLKEK
jgi:hypothetical protein